MRLSITRLAIVGAIACASISVSLASNASVFPWQGLLRIDTPPSDTARPVIERIVESASHH
ncbi:hypothetical protein [Halomonas litopenaei]|uniref:hypothetical protein n=1 Tax=Halomonas litopenaei TaxID=2109328 RepID=UPI003FA13AA8